MRTLDTGKRGEFLVLGELLKHRASVYVPVVDAEGIDAIVRRPGGAFIELQIKTINTPKTPRWFQVTGLQPRPSFFVIGVILATSPPEVWIIPSDVFVEYSSVSGETGKKIFDLDLDGGTRRLGRPKREILRQYLGAWHLLTSDREQREVDAISNMSMPSFAEDWDSDEDAVYDSL